MARTKSFSNSLKNSFSLKNGKGFLKNKTVLYIISFLALMNLLGYMLLDNFNAVVMFLAVGIISFQLSKNMIIVLLACILATNLYVVIVQKRKYTKEGFEAKDEKQTKNVATKDAKAFATSQTKKKDTKKKKSGFQNQGKNVIAKTAAPVKDDAEEVNSRIDYGTTIERAYDNLDNILGGDNMKKLTNDTTKLIEKQNKLVQNMQGMAPMISQYKDLLKNMNLDNIQNLAKKLTGSPLSLDPASKTT